ncbi:MAG: PIN domain-containing protein [Thermoplasmataceae archaeon]
MIIDTTYLLPLVGISVDKDLFSMLEKGNLSFNLDDTSVSEISLFEIQAKCAKLSIAHTFVSDAISEIKSNFEIVPFNEKMVIELSFKLRKKLPDYIDCVILATAISRNKDLLTEDNKILSLKEYAAKEYGISINHLGHFAE